MKLDRFTDFAHTGPGTLAGRYLRSFWQPIYLAKDLPSGQAVPVHVMSEHFTLYRSMSGTPHLVADRCAHRLSKLSTGWVEGEAIRCIYHGWKYDGQGQCIEQPAEPKPFCKRVQIASYPTTEYLGLVFAFLGEGDPPPFERDAELESRGLIWNTSWVWPCNFFQSVENYPDHSHVEFVHRQSPFSEEGLIGVPRIESEETEYGIRTTGRREAVGVRVNHFIMPNSHLVTVPPEPPGTDWVDLRVWNVPVDDESHVRFSAFMHRVDTEQARVIRERLEDTWENITPPHVLATEVLAGRLRREDVKPESTDFIPFQDALAQIGQGVSVDRSRERLGASDRGVTLLRRLWVRDLKAIAAGEHRWAWTCPDGLRGRAGVG